MKQYYQLLDPSFNPPITTYWCGESSKATILTKLRGFVIPLGTRKPKNVSRETIRQF